MVRRGFSLLWEGNFRRASKGFKPIPEELTSKVYLVTGANSGLGLACTKMLAQRGGTVYMLCRNEERGNQAMKKVKEVAKFPEQIFLRCVDVSEPSSVKELASNLDVERIDCLIMLVRC